uniref:PDZ domain-containing protein n=1 Tax=Cryptomonas curvata TaxID=233186 RepID=A0A7S0QMT4_9CRYP
MEREVGGNRGPAVTVVDAIIPGYAAHWSGQVVVGDILESVDGTEVEGWSLDAIKELTVGLEGTTCRLRLRRTVSGSPTGLEAVLTRIVPDAMREGTQQLEAADAYRAVASGLRNSFSSVDGKRSSVEGKRTSWR